MRMRTHQSVLKHAAKAVGKTVLTFDSDGDARLDREEGGEYLRCWNPREYPQDAFDLAITLRLKVDFGAENPLDEIALAAARIGGYRR